MTCAAHNSGATPGGGKARFMLPDGRNRILTVLPWLSPQGVEIEFWTVGTLIGQISATTAAELAQLTGLRIPVPDNAAEVSTLIQAGAPESTLWYSIEYEGCR